MQNQEKQMNLFVGEEIYCGTSLFVNGCVLPRTLKETRKLKVFKSKKNFATAQSWIWLLPKEKATITRFTLIFFHHRLFPMFVRA